MELKFYECDCDRCQSMCRRPCFGTVDDMEKIIQAGFENRLCVDYWGNCKDYNVDMLAPALKGFEGKEAPFIPMSEEGCTFFKDGKCELHDVGLKPTQGKTAIHGGDHKTREQVAQYIIDTWNTEKGLKILEEFKNKMGIE